MTFIINNSFLSPSKDEFSPDLKNHSKKPLAEIFFRYNKITA